ncbi:acyl-CoA dehydrogenase [Streptomyces sp. NRRL F-4489]|uniref:acyl-CoA dehydrogenase family protein n=1 Tax=Streptomyces sp. NRRL F-4489 TaxID=1609095 RepID=UPI0007469E8B|nr:acyl-CoA dehydrogenase family protein [Streptomyces sp. NRRL F-4489]KUL49003.1 acyl-CoA dehydrogenase [Streptomyces sp. NRRL F-4489]
MDFQLTDDQRALRAGARELLAGRLGPERLRERAAGGPVPDRALWRELAAAGFLTVRLPEEASGVGLGLPEAVLVCEEAGRALLPGPLVAGQLLAGVVDGVASGERLPALCDGAADPVLCELPDGVGELVILEGSAPGRTQRGGEGRAEGRAELAYRCAPGDVATAPFASVDPLTPLARVTGYPRTCPLPGLDAARLRREAALLTAAEQLGSAARTVEAAVAYARQRTQFGAPIGSFQAVKHLCAEMLVRAEVARAAVYAAAVTADPLDIAGAKLLADEAAVRNARDCLQVHGGMGFTWEAEVHLHLKRAWLRAERWCAAREAEERLADALAR